MIVLCHENDNWISEVGARLPSKTYVRNIYLPHDQVDSIREKYNNTSLHKSVWRYNQVEDIDDALIYGDFYMDFDSHESFQYVKEDALKVISLLKIVFGIPEDSMELYFSGSKGVHLIVPAKVFGIEPSKSLHETFKFIVQYIKGYLKHKTPDTQVYHKKAFLRMANSIHEKTGLYKARITIQELITKSQDEIKELAKKPRELSKPKDLFVSRANQTYLEFKKKADDFLKQAEKIDVNAVMDFDPPCITYLLNTVTPQGQRNYIATVLASHFKTRGYDSDKTLEILKTWNMTYCSPRATDIELKRTVTSIYKGNKRYGCSSLKSTGGCDECNCRIAKNRGGSRNG